jgi:hypothetical protein
VKIERIRLHEWVLGLCVVGLLLAAMLRRSKDQVSLASASSGTATAAHSSAR